jgi:hypothetical protein
MRSSSMLSSSGTPRWNWWSAPSTTAGSVALQIDGQSLRTKTSKRPEHLGRAARIAELELRYAPVTLRGTPADADQPVTPELPPERLFSDIELRVLGDYAQSRS